MKKAKKVTIKRQLEYIIFDLSWAKISTKHFEKSRSWLYHKLDDFDDNGKPLDFTEKKEQLRNALFDISDRIRKTAEKLV